MRALAISRSPDASSCPPQLGWGIFTFAQAVAQNSIQMYGESKGVLLRNRPAAHAFGLAVFRFFVGAFEASFFPAVLYLLGSWYSPVSCSDLQGSAFQVADRVSANTGGAGKAHGHLP